MSRGGNAISRSPSRLASPSPVTRFENALREETARRHQLARERYSDRSRTPPLQGRRSALVLVSYEEVEKSRRVEHLLEQVGRQIEAIRESPSRLKVEDLLDCVSRLGAEAGVNRDRGRVLLDKGVWT